MIKLYTTGICPKCRVIKMKLEAKGVDFTVSSDVDEMKSLGISKVPVLNTGDRLIDDTTEINNYVNSL